MKLSNRLAIVAYCLVLILVHDHGEDNADAAADDARGKQGS